MEICPQCNLRTAVSEGKFSSPIGSTDVYLEQFYICTNPSCKNYAGADLLDPKIILATNKTKVG